MTTQLQIGQMALAEIGTRSTVTPTALTPNGTVFGDGSEEALYLDMYYGPVRDQALRAARWNFAKHTGIPLLWKAMPGTPEFPVGPSQPAIPSDTSTGWSRSYPAPPWLYSYVLQDDVVYAQSVIPQLFPVFGGSVALPRALKMPFEIANDPYDQTGLVYSSPTLYKRVLLTNAQAALLEYTGFAAENLWDTAFIMTMVMALAGRLAIALTGDKQLAQIKLQAANGMIQEARARDGNEGVTILDHIPDWLSVRGAGSMSSTLQYDFTYPYGPMFTMSAYL